MSTLLSFDKKMLISHKHASLPGHFPDNPVVPAVVILDQIIRLWQNKTNKNITQLSNSKFIQVLMPDTLYTIHYKETKKIGQINFEIIGNKPTVIVRGSFKYG